jgi:hypothetical protein
VERKDALLVNTECHAARSSQEIRRQDDSIPFRRRIWRGTRDLARRLGVTQPLLYRYFPSKDDLIKEVYRTVYLEPFDVG